MKCELERQRALYAVLHLQLRVYGMVFRCVDASKDLLSIQATRVMTAIPVGCAAKNGQCSRAIGAVESC
jgi:hypothetical protein